MLKTKTIIISKILKDKKNNSAKKTAKGFSMIELLIVIVIVVIMTAILLTNKTNKGAIEVQATTRTVAAQLRELQNDTINGKIVEGKNIGKAEMYLDNTTSPGNYSIKYYDDNGSLIHSYPFTPVKSTLQTKGTISFQVPTGQVTVNLDGSVNGVSLVSTNDSAQKMTVCVNNAGNITETKGDDPYCIAAGMCSPTAVWTNLGNCSVTCGGGQNQQRCDANCGATCSGGYTNGQTAYNGSSCNVQACCTPVDATLSVWGNCSLTCGGGTQTRTCSGASCGGDTTCGGQSLSQSCNTQACCTWQWDDPPSHVYPKNIYWINWDGNGVLASDDCRAVWGPGTGCGYYSPCDRTERRIEYFCSGHIWADGDGIFSRRF